MDSRFRQGCRGLCLEAHSLSASSRRPPSRSTCEEPWLWGNNLELPGLPTSLKGHPDLHTVCLWGSLFSPTDQEEGIQCTVRRKPSLTQPGVKNSVLGLYLLCLYSNCKQGTCYGSFPFCHDDCLLDSLEHTTDMSALIHHGVLGLQDPAQGVLWQCLSLNSEVWKTERSEVQSEGSSSDHSFRDILEVITYSWILPHQFLSHLDFPQRYESCINLHLYTNPNFGQLLQVLLTVLFTHTVSTGW